MRRITASLVLVSLLAGCGGAEPEVAQLPPIAEPRALATVEGNEDFALVGGSALAGRVRGRVLEVQAVPLDRGGPPASVFRFQAPRGAEPRYRLVASPERAALGLFTETDDTSLASAQSLIGPPLGPWEPLGPPRPPERDEFHPAWHEVDGATVFTTELLGDLSRKRVVVREPGAEPREVALPQATFTYAFAGDLVAYAVPIKGQPDGEPQRLVLRNWRTGANIATARVSEGIEALDVRPEGRVVVNDDGGGLLELRDGTLRRLSRGGVDPRYAGERIVFLRRARREGDERLAVVEPDGAIRPFGVPSAQIRRFVTDGERVLWHANGCLLVADVTAAAAPAPGPGPCPRSELFMDDLGGNPPFRRDRRVPLTLRCVAAAPPGCRGTVRVELAEEGPRGRDSSVVRFRIPAGTARRLAPRLTRRAYAAARREARAPWGLGGAGLVVHAVAVDPEGRKTRLRDGYVIQAAGGA